MSVSAAMIMPPVQDSAVASMIFVRPAGVEHGAGELVESSGVAHSGKLSGIDDACRGDRRDAFLAADEAELLVGRRLDRDAVRRNRQHFGQRCDHRLAVRPDPRRLGDQGDVGIGDASAACRAPASPHARRRCARPHPAIADRMAGNACRCRRRRRWRAARRSAHAAPTSASEWPDSFFACGIDTPHSVTWSPGSKACTS